MDRETERKRVAYATDFCKFTFSIRGIVFKRRNDKGIWIESRFPGMIITRYIHGKRRKKH